MSPTSTGGPRGTRTAAALVLAAALLLTGCGGTSAPGDTGNGGGQPSSSASSASAAPLTIDITMTGDTVSPNAEKIDASVGQQVVLHVTSDTADEVHAHTGGDGYELEVAAGTPATGRFSLDSPGSFEIESHGRGKVIAILNVR